MAKVFLVCTAAVEDYPFASRDFERLTAYAGCDRHQRHTLIDQPEAADIVVFVGTARPNYADVTGSSLYRAFRDKALIFFSGDRGIPLLPGLYTCLERRRLGNPPSAVPGFYLRVTDNHSLDIQEDIQSSDYLYSFVGNALNHPARKAICNLNDPRAFIRDSSGDARQQDDGITGENRERGLHYRDVMARSKFVLCPRGIGVSSWRLFETMRAGRVPVVISDDWIRPPGPEWDAFCVFVPEARIGDLPALLAQKESLTAEMGARARQEWERWYSAENIFNTAIDHLLLAQQRREDKRWRAWLATYIQYLDTFFLRYWVLSPVKHQLWSVANRRQ